VKEIFESYIENAFGERKQAEFKFRQFEYNYRRFFPQTKEVPVLDIGIGRGEMLSCMQCWGYENYLGIDISPSTVEFCKTLGLNCTEVSDTTGWLNKNKNRFGLITMLDVLEHIPKGEVISLLRSVKEALRSEGILIIQVPNLQAPDGQLHRYNDFTHETGFIEHSLRQVLLAAGFETINFYGFETLLGIDRIIKPLRIVYWAYVRFIRRLNCNLNPKILHPVFYAVVKKNV
jgi:2-polyprenyl-3-methyl-5-hydroxy-6-metoxy-1,4-benzoquinol methylase